MKSLKTYSLLLFILLLIFQIHTYPQAVINNLKSYSLSNNSNESGREIVRIFPASIYSNWAIAGITSTTNNSIDWLLLKLNEAGNVLCEEHLGFFENDSCYSIIRLPTGGSNLVLAGFYKFPFSVVNEAAWTILDTNCIHLLSKKIRGSFGSTYRQVINVINDFALTGYMKSMESMALSEKIIASKYNAVGNMIWGFKYIIDPNSNERAYSICYNNTDSTYAITGTTDKFRANYPGTYDIFILKINSAGIPIWFKVYKFNYAFTSEANKIITLPDGYAITGWTTVNSVPNGDLWILKTDFNGNILWSRTWGQGGKEVGYTLQYYQPNNCIFYGGYENTTGTEDLLWGIVNNVNGLGLGLPKIHINVLGNDRVYDLKFNYITPNSSINVVSTGELFVGSGSGNQIDVFYSRNPMNLTYINCLTDHLMATSEAIPVRDSLPVIFVPLQDSLLSPIVNSTMPAVRDECLPTGIDIPKETKVYKYDLKQNYPNPFNPITRIQYELPENAFITLEIYNTLGERISILLNEQKSKGIHYLDFDGTSLSSGTYYCTLTAGNFRKSIIIVLIK